MRNFDLLNTEETPKEYHKTKLTIGINGQKALEVGQVFAMERMYKNWNDWRVKLAVWLIRKTELNLVEMVGFAPIALSSNCLQRFGYD